MARGDPIAVRVEDQVCELAAAEREVRAAGEDAVHRMRVATRRLRSVLRTFRPGFCAGTTHHLEAELRWLGDLLGAERDAEVEYSRILSALGELAPEQAPGEVRSTIADRREADLGAAHSALVAALDSPRYAGLRTELAAFATDPPRRSGHHRRRSYRQLRKAVRRCTRRVTLAEGLEGRAREAALHEARKAIKHVRYAAETLRRSDGVSGLVKAFTRLQAVLGDHHDAVVARDLLGELSAACSRPESGFALGILFGEQQDLASRAEARFVRSWRRARRRGAYRRLAG